MSSQQSLLLPSADSSEVLDREPVLENSENATSSPAVADQQPLVDNSDDIVTSAELGDQQSLADATVAVEAPDQLVSIIMQIMLLS
jgi:hypothetical protein